MEKQKVFVRNNYGIKIVKCCASCEHKALDNRSRLCTIGEGIVASSHCCKNWQMAEAYKQAGKGGGVVKKKDYLDFVINRLEENAGRHSISSRPNRESVVTLRKEYLSKFGSYDYM